MATETRPLLTEAGARLRAILVDESLVEETPIEAMPAQREVSQVIQRVLPFARAT